VKTINPNLNDLKIKIFADGADVESMLSMSDKTFIKGFTTNPTLMRKAGITDYEKFAKIVLKSITNLPVSFEVFADEPDEIEKQAIKISNWGSNVNVKIPITNTKGISLAPSIKKLSNQGVQLNITAILTLEQVEEVVEVLNKDIFNIISVFAGRIADTGTNPKVIMKDSKKIIMSKLNKTELLWASPRQALNILEANDIGCDIITVTPDLLKKTENFGKNLTQLSLETVQMFCDDAMSAGYKL
jgi:transaldolase